jgi:hypothetical protein
VSEEYQALRQEVLAWQERRFAVVAGAAVGVTAVLGWVTSNPVAWTWTTPSLLLLTVLSGASYLTWLFGRFNAMIGAYLEVAHGSAWDEHSRRFRARHRYLRLNVALGAVYVSLGLVSVLVPCMVCPRRPGIAGVVALVGAALVFTGAAGLLMFWSYPRESYRTDWERILESAGTPPAKVASCRAPASTPPPPGTKQVPPT